MRCRHGGRLAATALVLLCAASGAYAAPPPAPNSTPAPAGGEDPKKLEEALARFNRGQDLYRERNFPAALTEFRRAYEAAPNYRVFYNIGQVCFQMQDYVCALQSFERYLAEGGADVPEARRQSVQSELAPLRARIGSVEIRANVPGAEISVDDVVVGVTPLAAPVVVGAGRHKVVATLVDRSPVTRVVDVAGQDHAVVELTLASLRAPSVEPTRPALPPPAAEPTASRMTTASWVGYGVGAGLLVGGGILGGLALSSASDVNGTTYPDTASAGSDKSRTTAFAATSDGLLLAGAITVVTTTIFTFVVPHGNTKQRALLPAALAGRFLF